MDPYIGEIRLWPGMWAPLGWFFCQGQALSIQAYAALYSLMGISFGGDGVHTFNLPDLRSRVVIGQGQGQGLSMRPWGTTGGSATVTLLLSQMAAHNHLIGCQAAPTTTVASNTVVLANGASSGRGGATKIYDTAPDNKTTLNAGSIGSTGGNMSHNNMQPTLTMNFMIAYDGIYPVNPN